MPSFTTIYRAIVMVAASIIIVKGWQMYGPSAEQANLVIRRAVEIGQAAWKGTPTPATAASASSPTQQAPLVPLSATENAAQVASLPRANTATVVPDVPVAAATTITPSPTPHEIAAAGPQLPSRPAALDDSRLAAPVETPDLPESDSERLPLLMTRLEQLGGLEPELAAWGTSGKLYRFRCRATWSDSPKYSRHFEAVAAEPMAAVEQVVAKVQAWRHGRDGSQLR
jgi:hypothetical protein